ncbi:MAG: hypothetical protein KAT48_05810, partial [Bacteroidales bacterium]|nr:hypothetical protein [Bacteroidales bacterium]
MKTTTLTFILVCMFLFLYSLKGISQITRGASPGEIYISGDWYHDGLHLHHAIFRSSDNGETIELKYHNIDNPPTGEMEVGPLNSDATPGVTYNYGYYPYYDLWVSFNYGVSWEFIEHHSVYTEYFSGVVPGTIFKGNNEGFFKSADFGFTFEPLHITFLVFLSEVGYTENEFFGLYGVSGLYYNLIHTIDYGQTYTEFTIDSTVALWQIYAKSPQLSRGTEPGELYLVSWWFEYRYKIFHSVDTGYTWTLQYESEEIDPGWWGVQYTAGQAPGSFYVKRSTIDPELTHSWVYIDYSSDYGQTFTTYFHDLGNWVGTDPPNEATEPRIKTSCYPNPFYNHISFDFSLPEPDMGSNLQIFNIHGNLIKEYKLAGKKQISWDGIGISGQKVESGI